MIFHYLGFLIATANAAPISKTHTVIVKASRLEDGETSAGPSVSVITASDLKNLPVTTVGHVLREIPGLNVIQSGGPGQVTTVFFRGAPAEEVLVLVDGIEVNDVSGTSRSFDFSNLTTDNIKRIEIFRGPQALRFGANAAGGVVNVITRKGNGPFALGYRIEGGSYSTANGSISAAEAQHGFNYSFGANDFTTRGFSAADSQLAGNSEPDGVHRVALSSRAGYDWSKMTGVDFTAHALFSRADLDFRGGAYGDDPNYVSGTRELLAGGDFHSRYGNGRLASRVTFGYSKIHRGYDNNPDPVHATDYHEQFSGESQNWDWWQEYDSGDSTYWNSDLQFKSETSSSMGGRNSNGVLGEAIIGHKEIRHLTIDGGVRHDQATHGGSAVTYSLGPAYDFARTATVLGATLSSGFRIPSLYQLYSSYGSRDLNPEHVTSWQVSLKQNWRRDSSLMLTYFDNRYRDLIDFDETTSKYRNISAVQSRGEEATFNGSLTTSLSVKAGYTHLDTHDESTGLRLLHRPVHSFFLGCNWQRGRWRIATDYRGVGRRDDQDPVTYTREVLPYYDFVAARVQYRWSRKLTVQARMENIFNRHFEEIAGYGTTARSFYAGISGDF